MFSVAVTGVLKKYFSYIILFSRLLLLIRVHLYFIAEAFLRCLATFGCLLVFRRGTFSSDHSPSAGGACWLWPHCRGARRRQTPCLHCWVFFFGLTRFPREAFRFLPRDPPPHLTRRSPGSCGRRGCRGFVSVSQSPCSRVGVCTLSCARRPAFSKGRSSFPTQ